MLHLFIPSRNRAEILKSHTGRLFPEVPVVICADNEDLYRESGVANPLIIRDGSQDPPRTGKACSMNWVLDNLVPEGDWAVFLDDDLYKVTRVAPQFYSESKCPEMTSKERRQAFETLVINTEGLLQVLEDTTQYAEQVGASYAGVSSVLNPFFRQAKWGHVGWVLGCMALLRNTGRRFPITHDEEAWILADSLAQDGKVVINRYVAFTTPDRVGGGHGDMLTRVELRKTEHEAIMARWPGLMRQTSLPYVWGLNKEHIADYPMLRLAKRTEKQVAKWREQWLQTNNSSTS